MGSARGQPQSRPAATHLITLDPVRLPRASSQPSATWPPPLDAERAPTGRQSTGQRPPASGQSPPPIERPKNGNVLVARPDLRLVCASWPRRAALSFSRLMDVDWRPSGGGHSDFSPLRRALSALRALGSRPNLKRLGAQLGTATAIGSGSSAGVRQSHAPPVSSCTPGTSRATGVQPEPKQNKTKRCTLPAAREPSARNEVMNFYAAPYSASQNKGLLSPILRHRDTGLLSACREADTSGPSLNGLRRQSPGSRIP